MSLIYNEIKSRWSKSKNPFVISEGINYHWSKVDQLIQERLAQLPKPYHPALLQSNNNLELLVHFLACSLNQNLYFPLSGYRNLKDIIHWNNILEKVDWDSQSLRGGVLFYTSGTTDGPQLVYHPEQNLIDNAIRSSQDQKFNVDTVVGSFLTLAHSGGLNMQVLPALYSGGTVILENRYTPIDWLRISNQIDSCTLVPSQIFSLIRELKTYKKKPQRLKSILTGSMIVPKELFDWAADYGVELLSVYGLTEIGPYVATTREHCDGGLAYLGQVHPDFEFEIRDQEIFLRGKSQSFSMKFNEEKLTIAKAPWIATGDLGFANERKLFFNGRKKRRINFSGFKYTPEEVEVLALSYPGIINCALISRPSPTYGEVGVLYYVGDVSKQNLRKFLAENLASYKIPREIHNVCELPHTDLYKPNYQELARGKN